MNFKRSRLGVIIGRFQVDEISQGHTELITEVAKLHERILILVGVSPIPGTIENPLDYATRERMLRDAYPYLTILPIMDQPNDIFWSENVDQLIRSVFPIGSVCIYGGRDSFIPHYHGSFDTAEFPVSDYRPGTAIREELGNLIPASSYARHGVIYSTQNQFPRAFVCIDAIVHNGELAIIAGEKPGENGRLRLPGGFLNPRETPEAAVRREVLEETGVSVSDPVYVTSRDTSDWRFEGCRDGLITLLFSCEYAYGPLLSSDDLQNVRWVDLRQVGPTPKFIPSHDELIREFIKRRQ